MELPQHGDIGFWKSIMKGLTFEGLPSSAPSASTVSSSLSFHLKSDGWSQLGSLATDSTVNRLREAVEALSVLHLPPSFVFLSDQAWQTHFSFAERMGMPLLGDVLAWNIGHNQSGFSPHRDRQPNDLAASFYPDGRPKYCTCWMALSHVGSDNSSLFIIPAHVDPGYHDASVDLGDPLSAALSDKTRFQHIRSFQGPPGSAWVFSHRLLHWGSTNLSTEPRISISFVCSDPSFEAPYVSETLLKSSVEVRLALVSAQLINYYQRFNFSQDELLWFYKEFSSQSSVFSDDYVGKTQFELVKALREFDELNEEAEEVMVELMLDLGQDEVSDDFKEMGSAQEDDDGVELNDNDNDDDDDDDDDDDGDDQNSRQKRHKSTN